MWSDPIVDQVRAEAKNWSDQFGGDLHAMFEELRRLERESGREVIALPPDQRTNLRFQWRRYLPPPHRGLRSTLSRDRDRLRQPCDSYLTAAEYGFEIIRPFALSWSANT